MTKPRQPEQWQYKPLGHRRLRRRRLILAGGALAATLAVCGVLIGIVTSRLHDQSVEVPTGANPTATVTMDKPISDGPIEFLVESVKPLEVAPDAPAEQFQVLTLKLTNTGPSTQSVSPSDQVLIDDRGHEYHLDPVMASHLNDDQGAIELQSHAIATMELPFDVPADAVPMSVVLHAGPLTPGVAVTLRQ